MFTHICNLPIIIIMPQKEEHRVSELWLVILHCLHSVMPHAVDIYQLPSQHTSPLCSFSEALYFPAAVYTGSRDGAHGWGLANHCVPPALPQWLVHTVCDLDQSSQTLRDFCWECIFLLLVSKRHIVLWPAEPMRGTMPKLKLIP